MVSMRCVFSTLRRIYFRIGTSDSDRFAGSNEMLIQADCCGIFRRMVIAAGAMSWLFYPIGRRGGLCTSQM